MENIEVIKIVHASILGDGFFYKVDQTNNKANTHFMLKQTGHDDYINWMANKLESVTRVTISTVDAYVDKRGYNIAEQKVLKTMRHPFYKTMYNRLYSHVDHTHIKRLDPHYLKLVDWQSLAMIYMDDGWIDVSENKIKDDYIRISLSTHCFSYFENLTLRQLLAEKFGIHGEVKHHKQKSGNILYFLQFKQDNAKRFLEGVKPFIFPSFEYKLQY